MPPHSAESKHIEAFVLHLPPVLVILCAILFPFNFRQDKSLRELYADSSAMSHCGNLTKCRPAWIVFAGWSGSGRPTRAERSLVGSSEVTSILILS